MYQQFYQLRSLPFEITADPVFFFASEQHREALAAIEYTIRMRKGFVLITGDIGSGKTTVGRAMCQRCSDTASIVHVTHGHQERTGLIRQILRSLQLPVGPGDDHSQMLENLQEHLCEQASRNRPVVVFVDEAQTLSDEALDELRLLGNFDTHTTKLVQVVMIGQPELRRRIRSARHAPLRQRIVMSRQLRPMNQAETGDYIRHRLRIASENTATVNVSFEPAAIAEIYRHTQGVPRLINVLCDNCLLLGFVRETRSIDAGIVQRVREDMVPSFEDAGAPSQPTHRLSLAG